MSHLMRKLRGSLFGISPTETSFARRGFFIGESDSRQRLEKIGGTFPAARRRKLPGWLVRV